MLTMRKDQMNRMRLAIADVGDNADARSMYLNQKSGVTPRDMTLFHTTPIANVESIKHSGLRPRGPQKPKPVNGKPNEYPQDGVFLGNFGTAERLRKEWEKEYDQPFAMLQVRIPKNTAVYDDPLMPGESVMVKKIASSNIRVLTPTHVAILSQTKAANNDLNRLFGGSHE